MFSHRALSFSFVLLVAVLGIERIFDELRKASDDQHDNDTIAWAESAFTIPPDTRHRSCSSSFSDVTDLPHVSIIIPYLNETWQHIRGTVASLLWFTPMSLVDAIIFVDDANDASHTFKAELEALHPKVQVFSNSERQGLIRSKMFGASFVTSPVIFFLEPHCVVNRFWLEPLLVHMITSPSNAIVTPVIDVIPADNFGKYNKALEQVGAFTWGLDFMWLMRASDRNKSYKEPDAFQSPALSGGIFGIWRSFWIASGAYDPEMSEWGGEHIELSLKTWMCGGTIETVPCSRIGHMFRAVAPYSMKEGQVLRNLKRVALVWLDDFIEKFFSMTTSQAIEVGDISSRMELRNTLGCQNMTWYISNIYPELLDEVFVDAGGNKSCYNKNPQCEHWAALGECARNPGFMLAQCSRSCGACAAIPDCSDADATCAKWAASGECARNPSYMLLHCQRSCGACFSDKAEL